ncbi:pyridoxamine 5'-phosphate oxidase family protein [Salinisphaera orenii]|uniref:pyridoxamine 5'-phosphate oxidase family protein n=1 Tax=Salinisphaera orenii TaxID=856731 RepID=UPI000DBE9EC7
MACENYETAIVWLKKFIHDAETRDEPETNAAALATVDTPTHRPSVRTVYIHVDNFDPIFFVKTRSGKQEHLYWNGLASVCFFWRQLAEQIILDGEVEQLTEERADAVWQQQRSHASAIANRASDQQTHAHEGVSEAFESRRRHAERAEARNGDLPRPVNWIGYRLLPEGIAFWKTGWDNPHMRQLYQRAFDGQWHVYEQEP